MRCGYFDARACASCSWMGRPYAEQLAAKDALVRELLAGHTGIEWLPPIASPESGYRTKAKLAVGGAVDAPTFGILDGHGRGVDLRGCGITSPAILAAVPAIDAFVRRVGIVPYDVPARRGELKHVLVTEGEAGALMVRFVLRSTADLARISKHLPTLRATLPQALVLTANIHPEHRALVEGDRELPLTEARELAVRVGDATLRLRPQSFVQTNTEVAGALYREARTWVEELGARRIRDLYCGAGGFALHLAGPGREVLGIELDEEAVASARRAADGVPGLRFEVGDATRFPDDGRDRPDLVVVNPPRRGLGAELAARLEAGVVPHVLYSSCNPRTLAEDLERMPSLRPVRARVLDMFPQTPHLEALVLLARDDDPPAPRRRRGDPPPHGMAGPANR